MRKINNNICESAVPVVGGLQEGSIGLLPTGGLRQLSAVKLVHSLLDDAFAGGKHLTYIDGAFCRFHNTHWIAMSEPELGGAILHHLSAEASQSSQRTRALIREIIDLLRMRQATRPDRNRLVEPLPVINVANGELWIGVDGSVERRPP